MRVFLDSSYVHQVPKRVLQCWRARAHLMHFPNHKDYELLKISV